jgi:hypothetical protein
MTRTLLLGLLSLALLLSACSSGATVLDRSDAGSVDADLPLDSDLLVDAQLLPVDADSPPLVCASPGRLELGGPGAPPAAPPITVAPDDTLTVTGEGEISLVALESGTLTVAVDLGTAGLRTFRVEDAGAAPEVTMGAPVQIDYGRISDSTRDVSHLVLRDPDGAILAAYVRAGGAGNAPEIAAYLGERLDADLRAEVECRSSIGGYCGRGRMEYVLVAGEERAAAGESLQASTPSGPVTISVGVLADDNDAWPERTICAYSSLVAAELEAHGIPSAEGTHYELVPATVDVLVSHERCTAADGATAVVNATVHVYSSCLTPGPVFVEVDRTARTVTLSPFMWSEVGRSDCQPAGAAYIRDVAIHGLTEGEWTVTGITEPLRVGPRSPAACTGTRLEQGESCLGDCDCQTGLSCIATRGDATCNMRCERPCEPSGFGGLDLSCGIGAVCTVDPNVGAVCRTQTTDYCPATTCPVGTSCHGDTGDFASYCDWDVTLGSAARHVCTTNEDCGAGLDCVQHAGGARTCEIRCTSTDMRCPGPHACDPAATIDERTGVCGWIGD